MASDPIVVGGFEICQRKWVEKTYTYDDLLELFPDGDGSLVNPLVRRCQEYEARIAELEAENERLRAIADAAGELDAGSVVKCCDTGRGHPVSTVHTVIIDRIQEAWLRWKEAKEKQ